MNSALPTPAGVWVRDPALFCRIARSRPIGAAGIRASPSSVSCRRPCPVPGSPSGSAIGCTVTSQPRLSHRAHPRPLTCDQVDPDSDGPQMRSFGPFGHNPGVPGPR